MRILLHSNRTVEEVKEEFNNSFPYLKIVFISNKENDVSDKLEEVEPETRLIELNEILKEGDIDIQSTDSIKDVEQKFEKQHGLPVHIFRNQKGIWMDTHVTDDLTLHELNTWGRETSKPLKIKLDNRFNWDNLSFGK
jgi:hypothetical protein